MLMSATAGIIAPFLLRAIVDDALSQGDLQLLTLLAGGLIAVACLGAAITALQALVTSQVGQAIMHDLRVQVYAHLQSLSLWSENADIVSPAARSSASPWPARSCAIRACC
jgi:ATP-binding cassette subfamily B protein